MPTFNRQQFIKKAVDSILNQSHEDWELIIQNGGDSVKELLPDDKRIRLYEEKDSGITDAMNRGFKRATGDLFLWANDDDELVPGTLKYAVDNMNGHEWGYGYIYMTNGSGGHLWGTDWHTLGTQEDALKALIQNNFVPQPSVYWTRKAFETVGLMDEAQDLTSDYEYWIRLWKSFPPVFFDRIMAKYSIHADQITQKRMGEQLAQARETSKKHG